MLTHASELEAKLLQDPRILHVTVHHHFDALLLAEIYTRDGADDVLLIEMLDGKRFRVPVALAIKGSAEMLDVSSAQQRTLLDTPFEIAQTADEARMIELWQSLLEWAPIGRRDNFFDLGGDSLSGMRLMALLSEAFGLELDFLELVHTPVLHAFVSRVAIVQNAFFPE